MIDRLNSGDQSNNQCNDCKGHPKRQVPQLLEHIGWRISHDRLLFHPIRLRWSKKHQHDLNYQKHTSGEEGSERLPNSNPAQH